MDPPSILSKYSPRLDRWSTYTLHPEDLTRDADLFVEMWEGGRERGKECWSWTRVSCRRSLSLALSLSHPLPLTSLQKRLLFTIKDPLLAVLSPKTESRNSKISLAPLLTNPNPEARNTGKCHSLVPPIDQSRLLSVQCPVETAKLPYSWIMLVILELLPGICVAKVSICIIIWNYFNSRIGAGRSRRSQQRAEWTTKATAELEHASNLTKKMWNKSY